LELRRRYSISVVAIHDVLTDQITANPDPMHLLRIPMPCWWLGKMKIWRVLRNWSDDRGRFWDRGNIFSNSALESA
jgi:hypothetical protein